jgi:peptidyl-prolyl cis-trans isomerase A (cyclophilin A)
MTASRFLLASLLLALAACGPPAAEKKKAAPALPEKAPGVFNVRLETTKGEMVVEVTKSWAPHGAEHFYTLVKSHYFDGVPFYRVVRNFIAQFGISLDPAASRLWGQLRLPDDLPQQKNKKGTLAFAALGPASRTTQVFINLTDNTSLDKQNYVPFGRIVSGLDLASQLYSSYGEIAPRGNGPKPERIGTEGKEYLDRSFPRLDYIRRAVIVLPAKTERTKP